MIRLFLTSFFLFPETSFGLEMPVKKRQHIDESFHLAEQGFVEFKDPLEYCERFIKKEQKDFCEQEVSKEKLDWYFASYCDRIFDDEMFLQCLKKAQKTSVNPLNLKNCDQFRTDASIQKCLAQLDLEASGGAKEKRTPAHNNSKEPAYKPMRFRGK